MTYQFNEANEIRGQTINGETVTISEDECRGIVDCTLNAGILKLSQSNGSAMILRSVVKDCEVVADKNQRDYPLFKARFIHCTFHGVFSGIDFGCSPKIERDGEFGAIEYCDFTQATLDGCRFFNANVSTLRLPTWPHVVLVDFAKRKHEVAAAVWPGELGNYMRVCANQNEAVRASVIHVPSFAKLVACTEDDVREAFERFGGLQM